MAGGTRFSGVHHDYQPIRLSLVGAQVGIAARTSSRPRTPRMGDVHLAVRELRDQPLPSRMPEILDHRMEASLALTLPVKTITS